VTSVRVYNTVGFILYLFQIIVGLGIFFDFQFPGLDWHFLFVYNIYFGVNITISLLLFSSSAMRRTKLVCTISVYVQKVFEISR